MKIEILNEVEAELARLPDSSVDLSDIGNSFALAIYKFISEDKLGFSVDDFKSGIEHGLKNS